MLVQRPIGQLSKFCPASFARTFVPPCVIFINQTKQMLGNAILLGIGKLVEESLASNSTRTRKPS